MVRRNLSNIDIVDLEMLMEQYGYDDRAVVNAIERIAYINLIKFFFEYNVTYEDYRYIFNRKHSFEDKINYIRNLKEEKKSDM